MERERKRSRVRKTVSYPRNEAKGVNDQDKKLPASIGGVDTQGTASFEGCSLQTRSWCKNFNHLGAQVPVPPFDTLIFFNEP
ncbi:hypothetical protein CEXT_552521 [Caerostris extrusa]|uniref:Uncharacterized protein n=1 Tax=Caerostris extrusa TaxID=172846 RepID=A0AAV4YAE0_CAEEX|nr:hypothetical protein CEXT_552521 [Caerostris extrusa]